MGRSGNRRKYRQLDDGYNSVESRRGAPARADVQGGDIAKRKGVAVFNSGAGGGAAAPAAGGMPRGGKGDAGGKGHPKGAGGERVKGGGKSKGGGSGKGDSKGGWPCTKCKYWNLDFRETCLRCTGASAQPHER